uniref:NADH dehydrogenase subunit 2 n=1 Tax=Periclimenes brevicarpalis TaxID=390963 RepID=UPI001FA70F44|nr:NADH dehydrogenase subunit 2 [Periclimenes brevicarpalis]UMY76325.1 NADH dehydrogenase subunit 2 [Periclimenes brevicarpalis]
MLLRPSSLMFAGTLIIGTLVSISSTSWYLSWMGLELNTLSFIPLIWSKQNSLSSETALKYFLVQAFGSAVLITGVVITPLSTPLTHNLMMVALILKMGAAPLHFWLPNIMQGLSWYQCITLMTVQKIAPLALTSYVLLPENKWVVMSTSIMSALFGGIGGLNQTLLRKIMAYSSINHISWMLASMFMGTGILISYFVMYSVISSTLALLFSENQLFHLKQLPTLSSSPMNMVAMFVSLFSLGGLPPFLGFIPKMSVALKMATLNLIPWLFVLIMSSLITLFFYTRVATMSLTLYSPKVKTNRKTHFKSAHILLINMVPVLAPMLLVLYF